MKKKQGHTCVERTDNFFLKSRASSKFTAQLNLYIREGVASSETLTPDTQTLKHRFTLHFSLYIRGL